MERVAALHPLDGPLLEIGSLDVNGSVRDLFPRAVPYVGIDLGPGRAVDVVASGHDFGRDGSFATVVTTECLEHDPGWRETLLNIERVLRPGGRAVLHYGDVDKPIANANPGFSRMTRARMEGLIARTRLAVLDHDTETVFHSNLVALAR